MSITIVVGNLVNIPSRNKTRNARREFLKVFQDFGVGFPNAVVGVRHYYSLNNSRLNQLRPATVSQLVPGLAMRASITTVSAAVKAMMVGGNTHDV